MISGKPWNLMVQAFTAWSNDGALQLGAALAYYAAFSISPFLTIILSIAGFIYKGNSVTYIHAQVLALAGAGVADTITGSIRAVNSSPHTLAVAIVSIIVLFVGASGFFVQLASSMNQIWGIRQKTGCFWKDLLKERLLSLGMIFAVALVLMISVAISAGVAAGGGYFGHVMPAAALLAKVLEASVSFSIVVLLFAAIFKLVPNVAIGWNDVWIGALLTAVLFTAGKLATGWYLEQSGIGSPFGATGSILVVLAWVYYSSQILFFGAEFTKIYAGQQRVISKAGRGR